jgi:TPR repeat protein
VMDTAIHVLSPSQRLLDSRSVRLEWVARKEPPPQRTDTIDPANQKVPAAQQIDPQQAEVLMKRGRDALASGDIAAARLAFRRLADAGNAEAALGLGATYDPRYLASQNVIGVAGDEAQARVWYQRAVQLGSIEAKNILKQMATK